MSRTFRRCRPEEIPQLADLTAHAFPAAGRTRAEWEETLQKDVPGGTDAIWVGEEESRLVAGCLLYPLQQWIAGEAFPTMGLAGVAISPTDRRRGLAAQLLEAGFREALQRGDIATALYPFQTRFYQRLGYAMAGEVLQYHFPPEALPDAPERQRVSLVERDADHDAVRDLYGRWAPAQTGQLVRGEWSWKRTWDGGRHGVIYRNEQGEPEGYLVFVYGAGVRRDSRSVQVEEAVFLTVAARRGLYGWLASLSDQWQQIVYRAHPDEGFSEWLRELRHPQPEVPRLFFCFPTAVQQQGPMFRLLDVAAAWRRRRIAPGDGLSLRIEVDDPQLPENRGPWQLRLDGGRVEMAADIGGTTDASVSLGIEALSRAFIGAAPLSTLVGAERASIDRPEHLPEIDRLLRLPRPWTYDHF